MTTVQHIDSFPSGTVADAAARADQADQSVHDVIMEMLEQDPALDAAVKDAVLDALAEVVGRAQGNVETPTAPTLLTSISVVGCRGIQVGKTPERLLEGEITARR